jgi:tetratricopeptide (TPR) repeat protein
VDFASRETGIPAEQLVRAREAMARMQREYQESLGIRLPERYRRMADENELRRLMNGGDRYAAVRLGDLLAERGDVDGAMQAYQHAAELGAVAPLADYVAQWLDPQSNPAREYLQQRFGSAPTPDFAKAYAAAWSAYLGGYFDAGLLVDRMRRSIPPDQRAAYDGQAMAAYMQLLEQQHQRLGHYPQIELSPADLVMHIWGMQANYQPIPPPIAPAGSQGSP